MSFFAVKTYSDEFRSAIEGKVQSTPIAEDESVAAVADEIEDQTRDYILKKLAQELKGGSFEDFIAHLLQAMGYKTRQPTCDPGNCSDAKSDI
jgi:restriction system protein